MSHSRPCHHRRFGLRGVRSTLVMSASNHTTAAASSGAGGSPAPATKGSAAGRKSRPTLRPPLAAINSWISGSGSARPRSGSSSISTISGTSRPSARPTSPATSSATSARGPWPAPRNFRTYRPSSSASTSPGIDPPSRSGVTYRVAVTVRGAVVVGAPSLTAATLDPRSAPRPAGRCGAMVASHARAGRDLMLHLMNGDSAVSGIEATGVGGDVVPWRDALHEGPLPADADAAQLRAVRARFLADCGWGDADAIEAGMRARDERLAAARDTGEPIVLWFEHDLYDQLQLLQVLDAIDGAAAVEAILPDRFLGAMAPGELAALWDERAPVRRDEVALARLAWEAVRAPEPAAIGALLDTHTAALPHLAPALRRLLEELPAVGDGLGRAERQALEGIAAGARTPHAIFFATQQAEQAPFLGDSWMWARLSGLGQGDGRLVQTTAGAPLGPPPPLPGTEGFARQAIELAANGPTVLDGDADRAALVPLDRWVGGIRVRGPEPAWRFDPARGRAVAA